MTVPAAAPEGTVAGHGRRPYPCDPRQSRPCCGRQPAPRQVVSADGQVRPCAACPGEMPAAEFVQSSGLASTLSVHRRQPTAPCRHRHRGGWPSGRGSRPSKPLSDVPDDLRASEVDTRPRPGSGRYQPPMPDAARALLDAGCSSGAGTSERACLANTAHRSTLTNARPRTLPSCGSPMRDWRPSVPSTSPNPCGLLR